MFCLDRGSHMVWHQRLEEQGEERGWAGLDTFGLFHQVPGAKFKGRALTLLKLRSSNLSFLLQNERTTPAHASTRTRTRTRASLGVRDAPRSPRLSPAGPRGARPRPHSDSPQVFSYPIAPPRGQRGHRRPPHPTSTGGRRGGGGRLESKRISLESRMPLTGGISTLGVQGEPMQPPEPWVLV